jgi:hypothetical protein
MKLVKGDIIRNPWVSDPKWRDFIFIRAREEICAHFEI